MRLPPVNTTVSNVHLSYYCPLHASVHLSNYCPLPVSPRSDVILLFRSVPVKVRLPPVIQLSPFCLQCASLILLCPSCHCTSVLLLSPSCYCTDVLLLSPSCLCTSVLLLSPSPYCSSVLLLPPPPPPLYCKFILLLSPSHYCTSALLRSTSPYCTTATLPPPPPPLCPTTVHVRLSYTRLCSLHLSAAAARDATYSAVVVCIRRFKYVFIIHLYAFIYACKWTIRYIYASQTMSPITISQTIGSHTNFKLLT